MFSKSITNSAKFLKMPLECQALYFHLAQNADDDGISEGFTIMRLVGASEDSLKILSAKKYIEVLNDDLVIFVIDWLEHNSIRADRKKNSLYQNLLLEKMPEIKLLEPKERADRSEKDTQLTAICQPVAVNGTSQGQSMDCLGEGRVGKDSIEKEKTDTDIFFNELWILYPNKIGKNKVSKTQREKLLKIGIEEMTRATERYIKGKEDWKAWQQGSTFFNTSYEDYLDENYIEVVKFVDNRYRDYTPDY
jgi:hypothetical protein